MSAASVEAVLVPTEDGDLPASLWVPPTDTSAGEPGHGSGGMSDGASAAAGPGLVVLQEIFGVSDYVRSRCADLAALGYTVLAPELYWRLPQQRVEEDAENFLEQGMALMQAADWDTAVADGAAALAYLEGRPEVAGSGLVGFCYGGGLAFAVAARTEPAALVAYYGSALPQLLDLAPQVTCPSLHHFGTADDYLPMDTVERIREAVTERGRREDVRVELHEGAGHAFDNPHPMFHHAAASAAAWEQTVAFLGRHLPA